MCLSQNYLTISIVYDSVCSFAIELCHICHVCLFVYNNSVTVAVGLFIILACFACYAGLQASQPPMGGNTDGVGRQLRMVCGCNTHGVGAITPILRRDNPKWFANATPMSWGDNSNVVGR